MASMMSKAGNLGNAVGYGCPHLMFHVPKTEDAGWGPDLAGSPVLHNDEYRDVPGPETIFMASVFHWSDGTAAPRQASQWGLGYHLDLLKRGEIRRSAKHHNRLWVVCRQIENYYLVNTYCGPGYEPIPTVGRDRS